MNSKFKTQWQIISRGSEEIIGQEELEKKLRSGKRLTVKFGADPTAPDLHLGHTVVMEKLRQFQELGHRVVFIIGDFTAMVGDPSGRTAERPVLSREVIEESVKGYRSQVFKILNRDDTELVRNSKWLKPLGAEGLIRLASRYTVARMLERNDFEQRYRSGNPISITEFLYPLLQGYDSVVVESDIEIGGTDQKFNLLVGRDLQKDDGQDPQSVLTMPLLEGTDGVRKMSKSYGNHIGIDEPPEEIYGKLMSVSDDLMYRYYTLLTTHDIADIKKIHPMEAKKRLAKEITAKYQGKKRAEQAALRFEKVVSGGQIPSDIGTLRVKESMKLTDIIYMFESGGEATADPMSKAEIKRRMKAGAVEFKGEKITDPGFSVEPGEKGVVRYGKRNFVKLD